MSTDFESFFIGPKNSDFSFVLMEKILEHPATNLINVVLTLFILHLLILYYTYSVSILLDILYFFILIIYLYRLF